MRAKFTTSWRLILLLMLFMWSPGTSATLSNQNVSHFLALAESAIAVQHKVLVTGDIEYALTTSPMMSPYKSIIEDQLLENLERRAFLAEHNITYTGFHTKIIKNNLEIKDTEAVLHATEYTVFDLFVSNDNHAAPKRTEYYQDYIFTFAAHKDLWTLVSFHMFNTTLPARPDKTQSPLDRSIAPSLPIVPGDRADEQFLETQTSLNRDIVIEYAYKHWRNYNLTYRNYNTSGTRGGDCTNFISQALRAGGWSDVGGWYRDTSVWWSNSLNQSWTWVNAHYWLDFTYKHSRGYVVHYVADLLPGDILQVDLDSDGFIDHSMIVTSKDANDTVYLTYHNNDTLNRPFWELYYTYPDAYWYGVRLT